MQYFHNPFEPKHPLTWIAREVLKDVNGKPHLYLLLEVKGREFPQRGAEPAGRIGNATAHVRAFFGDISPDNGTMKLYFPADTPDGVIEVGYDDGVLETIGELKRRSIPGLDRKRIPKNTVLSKYNP